MKSLTVVLEDNGNPSVTNRIVCREGLRREEQVAIR